MEGHCLGLPTPKRRSMKQGPHTCTSVPSGFKGGLLRGHRASKFDSKPQISGRSLDICIDKAKREPPTCDNGAHIATIKGGLQIRTGKGGGMGLCEGERQDEDAMAQAARRFRGRSCIEWGKKVVSRGARSRARCVAPGEGYQALKELVRSR